MPWEVIADPFMNKSKLIFDYFQQFFSAFFIINISLHGYDFCIHSNNNIYKNDWINEKVWDI